MTKIKFIKLTPTQLHRMRTGTHIHLMSALQDLFSAYQTENKRYQKLLAQFTEAIRHEDSFIGKPKAALSLRTSIKLIKFVDFCFLHYRLM